MGCECKMMKDEEMKEGIPDIRTTFIVRCEPRKVAQWPSAVPYTLPYL